MKQLPLEYYQCKSCGRRFRERPRSERYKLWLAIKCPKCKSSVCAHIGKYKKIYYLPGLYKKG